MRYHETTIIRHINDYIEKDKLKPKNGGSQGYLSVFQSKALYEHLHEHTYRYAYQIAHYIEVKWSTNFGHKFVFEPVFFLLYSWLILHYSC